MTERRTTTSERLWALIFVMSLIFVFWFFFLRVFGDEPSEGPATAVPSIGSYGQTYDPKP